MVRYVEVWNLAAGGKQEKKKEETLRRRFRLAVS